MNQHAGSGGRPNSADSAASALACWAGEMVGAAGLAEEVGEVAGRAVAERAMVARPQRDCALNRVSRQEQL